MKLIIISEEKMISQEGKIFNLLFNEGLSALHLRKPFSSRQETENLLNNISSLYHNRIVLHDHFELAYLYNIRGLHLNRRNNIIPMNVDFIKISRSCHSLKEVEEISEYDYVFLSPIFDSISKIGYKQAFNTQALEEAKEKGIINKKVIALGGISIENIPLVASYGFGGIAVLGTLWKSFSGEGDISSLLKQFNLLKTICDKL